MVRWSCSEKAWVVSHLTSILIPIFYLRTEPLSCLHRRRRMWAKTENINKGKELSNKCWAPLGPFPAVLDLHDDGSVYVIDTPGHLPGHVNLLCRTGQNKWVLLGGDACHDTRLLSGEKEIGTWKNDEGQTLCIHLDKAEAEKSIERIRQLLEVNDNVEVIIAHDHLWYENAKNGGRMFPNTVWKWAWSLTLDGRNWKPLDNINKQKGAEYFLIFRTPISFRWNLLVTSPLHMAGVRVRFITLRAWT